MTIRIAIPSRGRLKKPALKLLSRAGFSMSNHYHSKRSLFVPTSNPNVELFFVRARDIPKIVEANATDLGITGHDYVVESRARVKELLDLGFGKARLVVACHSKSNILALEDVDDSTRIATKYVNITREFFAKRGKNPTIVEVSGSTEIMPLLGVADIIVDLESTGTTLRLHDLRVIEVIMETSARLIASEHALSSKREAIEGILMALESVLQAEDKVWIVMNVPEEYLESVTSILPSMAGPTIARVLSETLMWEVNTVVSKDRVYEVIAEAKRRGARDILVIHLDRVVP
uniref:ATP phosphoribosyltransferase n=1 Tax=Fervidicoccus fontis TaxID=683846 RepID=A0A7J3ZLQ3_9CREN